MRVLVDDGAHVLGDPVQFQAERRELLVLDGAALLDAAHGRSPGRAAAWLFASTVCWPASWDQALDLFESLRRSASCWRSNAEPSSVLSSQSRLSRRPKRRRGRACRSRASRTRPSCENCWRNLAASSSAWPMAVTVRATASTCPVTGRLCVAWTTSWSFCAISPAALQQHRGLLVEAHPANRVAQLG